MTGCGWRPLYRLDARPAAREVKFSWEAEIWQSSGADWNGVEVGVATLHAPRAVSPPDLPQWIIRPQTPVPRKAKRATEAALADMESSEAAQAPMPEQEKKGTYTLWKLGRIQMPAGAKQKTLEDRLEYYKKKYGDNFTVNGESGSPDSKPKPGKPGGAETQKPTILKRILGIFKRK